MNNINSSARYASASSAVSHHLPANGEASPPVQHVAVDMPWQEVEEPGGLVAQRGQGQEGIQGEPNGAVMVHPMPLNVAAQVVDIANQINPEFLAAAVAIQDELDQPLEGVAPLEVAAPEGLANEGVAVPAGRFRCSTDTVIGCGAVVLALGTVSSTIVGGVLAFTAEDQQTQSDGLMAFCAGVGVIVGWCGFSGCFSE